MRENLHLVANNCVCPGAAGKIEVHDWSRAVAVSSSGRCVGGHSSNTDPELWGFYHPDNNSFKSKFSVYANLCIRHVEGQVLTISGCKP